MKFAKLCLTAFTLILTLSLSAIKSANANPDIKNESIKVLLNFKTNCNMQSLTREVTKTNGLKFNVKCGDKTFYPDGLIVLCPIRDVDASCKIMSKPKEFKFLNLIYGPMSKRVHESDQPKNEQ